ncbi:MAG: glutamate--tRNA ligase [Candidatus Krumholzibacteriia bacterium]
MTVRVRFAPSPTGSAESSLHMGVARTAVFNWLLARQQGGAFVLRIEDTDAERSNAASERALMESLRWLGLDWDEGPDVGGPHGPYRQSERLALYRDAAARLTAAGQAYPCFCSEERLAAAREQARAEGRAPRYDGRCAALDPALAEARAAREPHAIRFRVPAQDVVVTDAVRGDVRFAAGTLGDFVVLRASGLPVYNFACVVDDAAMGITHVLRGEDHLPNTQRQLLLYEALGAPPPVFAHLSMILGEDRSKLSKRHGAVSVEQYRAEGYPPDAIVNYLALLGWNPGDGREAMSRAELTASFTIERLNKSAAVFDAAKLDWLAGLKLREAGPAALLPAARAFLPDEDDAQRLLEITAVIDHLRCAADLPRELAALRGPAPAPDEEARPWLAHAPLFAALADGLAAVEDFGAEVFKAALKDAGKAVGAKGKELFMPVRVALTGRTHGPELAAVAAILGRDEVLARLRAATA